MKKHQGAFRALGILFVFSTFGCSAGGRAVVTDDSVVSVQLTCRMPDGKVLMTTDESIALSDRSRLYLARKENGPLRLTAGKVARDMGARGDLDVELANGVARSLVGMSSGEMKRVSITADPIPGPDGKPRLLPMARVRQRPREMKLSRKDFSSRFGKPPEIGAAVILDPAIPGAVSEITDTEVVVRFKATPGTEVETPFGTGVIREGKDAYEIVIGVREGAIVRTGPLLGRIVSVTDRMFTVDFTQPFAGEELTCDIGPLEVEQTVNNL